MPHFIRKYYFRCIILKFIIARGRGIRAWVQKSFSKKLPRPHFVYARTRRIFLFCFKNHLIKVGWKTNDANNFKDLRRPSLRRPSGRLSSVTFRETSCNLLWKIWFFRTFEGSHNFLQKSRIFALQKNNNFNSCLEYSIPKRKKPLHNLWAIAKPLIYLIFVGS